MEDKTTQHNPKKDNNEEEDSSNDIIQIINKKQIDNYSKSRTRWWDPTNLQTIVMIILFIIGIWIASKEFSEGINIAKEDFREEIKVAKEEFHYQKMYEYRKQSFEHILGLVHDMQMDIMLKYARVGINKNENKVKVSILESVSKSLQELSKAIYVRRVILSSEAVDTLTNYNKRLNEYPRDGFDVAQFIEYLNSQNHALMESMIEIQKKDMNIK